MAETKELTTEKKALTPEQKVEREAARALAFTLWRRKWRDANPEGTKEQRREAWLAVRRGEVKAARKIVRSMGKSGIQMMTTTVAATA